MTVSDTTVSGRTSDLEAATADSTGFPADYVALDLETTGFYPNSCAITEIGAVRVRGRRIVDRFQRLVNPLRPIPAQVVSLTGITDEMVADADPIDVVLPRFVSWLAAGVSADASAGYVPGADAGDEAAGTVDAAAAHATGSAAAGETGDGVVPVVPFEPIVGHNVSFDIRFLDWNVHKVLGGPFSCVDYDTMQISRTMFPSQRHHRLLDLIQRFDIADNEEHRALSDAIQTQQCFEWMRKYADRHAGRGRFGAVDWTETAAKGSDAVIHRQLTLY